MLVSKPVAGRSSLAPQHVLAKNDQGFLCRTDFQDRFDRRTDASNPRPVWIGMTGPAGTSLHDVVWNFTTRNGHSELPHQNHLTAEWRGNIKPGDKLSFLTVLVPRNAWASSGSLKVRGAIRRWAMSGGKSPA